MVSVELYKGKFTLIDNEDFEKINQFKWSWNGTYIFRKCICDGINSGHIIYLHRFIMGAKKGEKIDHKNRNTLDNRKENLRLVNNSQNTANRKIPINNSSGLKGVHLTSSGKWKALICYQKIIYHLGCFLTKEEAAHAYNKAAVKYFGEFAVLNFS